MLRCVEYSRYSTCHQSEKSIETQQFECGEYAKSLGGKIVKTYKDEAVSGGKRGRDGFQNLIKDINKDMFDVIIAYDLSRLSRDIEDIANLYKRCQFKGIKIHTCAEREIGLMEIILRGGINNLYLKEGSDRVRSALHNMIRNGRLPSTCPYGYETDYSVVDEKGERIKGIWKIHTYQSLIIQRIFEDLAAGKSAIQIAQDLNKDGVPGPANRPWRDNIIRGNRRFGDGIINNEIYKGVYAYNRSKWINDPVKDKKVRQPRPPEEWKRQDMPELAIIGDNLWKAAKAEQQKLIDNPQYQQSSKSLIGCRRNKYLLSGKLFCGACGSKMILVAKGRYGCADYRKCRICDNRYTMPRKEIEEEVLSYLSDHLLSEKYVSQYLADFESEFHEHNRRHELELASKKAQLSRVQKKIENILNAMESGNIVSNTVNQRLKEYEEQEALLENDIKARSDVEPPEMIDVSEYRSMLRHIRKNIYDKAIHPAVMNEIRPLIDKILLHPSKKGYRVEIFGDITKLTSVRTPHSRDFFVPKDMISE